MKQTYVVIMSCGQYDEHDRNVIYAGNDLNMALHIAKTTPYFNEGNQYVCMEVWEGGKTVEYVEIRSFDDVLI